MLNNEQDDDTADRNMNELEISMLAPSVDLCLPSRLHLLIILSNAKKPEI